MILSEIDKEESKDKRTSQGWEEDFRSFSKEMSFLEVIVCLSNPATSKGLPKSEVFNKKKKKKKNLRMLTNQETKSLLMKIMHPRYKKIKKRCQSSMKIVTLFWKNQFFSRNLLILWLIFVKKNLKKINPQQALKCSNCPLQILIFLKFSLPMYLSFTIMETLLSIFVKKTQFTICLAFW